MRSEPIGARPAAHWNRPIPAVIVGSTEIQVPLQPTVKRQDLVEAPQVVALRRPAVEVLGDAAAWLIRSGIEANREFFEQVYSTVGEIRRLRERAQALANRSSAD